MTDSLFSNEQLVSLPLHFRTLHRNPIAQVAELGTSVRFSSSRQHQSARYRQLELHKPVSEIDYVSLMDFARQYKPPTPAQIAESALAQ